MLTKIAIFTLVLATIITMHNFYVERNKENKANMLICVSSLIVVLFLEYLKTL